MDERRILSRAELNRLLRRWREHRSEMISESYGFWMQVQLESRTRVPAIARCVHGARMTECCLVCGRHTDPHSCLMRLADQILP